MTSFTKAELLPILQRHRTVQVHFTKANGDPRIMNCTLHRDLLPKQQDIVEHTTKVNDAVIAVWDLDKAAWRSFRVDSVHGVLYDGNNV